MFSFNFELDEVDDELVTSTQELSISTPPRAAENVPQIPHARIPLSELLATLPPVISYTPVVIPLPTPSTSNSGRQESITLLRRDLFDARFQILSDHSRHDDGGGFNDDNDDQEDEDEDDRGPDYIDEESDLIKGVYEGGLKVWECSLDLVEYLFTMFESEPDQEGRRRRVKGKKVVELGCGTALPSCYVFSKLLAEIRAEGSNSDATDEKLEKTRLDLQDYNRQVLSLITLPNLLLTYAHHLTLSSTTEEGRILAPTTASATITSLDEDDSSRHDNPEWMTQPGELELSPEFLDSFTRFLEEHQINLEFYEGSWERFAVDDDESTGSTVDPAVKYDLLLSSETIYQPFSLPSLIDILRRSFNGVQLIACKRIYFGVGGGELEFIRQVEDQGGKVETVWSRGIGVGRVVLKVSW